MTDTQDPHQLERDGDVTVRELVETVEMREWLKGLNALTRFAHGANLWHFQQMFPELSVQEAEDRWILLQQTIRNLGLFEEQEWGRMIVAGRAIGDIAHAQNFPLVGVDPIRQALQRWRPVWITALSFRIINRYAVIEKVMLELPGRTPSKVFAQYVSPYPSLCAAYRLGGQVHLIALDGSEVATKGDRSMTVNKWMQASEAS